MRKVPAFYEGEPQTVPPEFLGELIDLVNLRMHTPAWGQALRLASPYSLTEDSEPPLPPGVRRVIYVVEAPFERDFDLPGAEALVFRLYCIGHEHTIQLSAEQLLDWASRAEAAAMTFDGAARDIGSIDTLRSLIAEPDEATSEGQEYAAAATGLNQVADEVRAAVAKTANWLPIARTDQVTAAVSAVYPYPAAEECEA
jgi:hypothetical protein